MYCVASILTSCTARISQMRSGFAHNRNVRSARRLERVKRRKRRRRRRRRGKKKSGLGNGLRRGRRAVARRENDPGMSRRGDSGVSVDGSSVGAKHRKSEDRQKWKQRSRLDIVKVHPDKFRNATLPRVHESEREGVEQTYDRSLSRIFMSFSIINS